MGLWSRLKKTIRGGSHADEIEEELQFHLDMDAAGGHSPRDTRLRLGNTTRIAEETRAMGIVEWLESVIQDARYGFRQLRKTPALATAVVLSLALGVGANTAIFSLVDAALLRPLPVKDPDSLRIIEWTSGGFPDGVDNINGEFRPIAGNRFQSTSISAHLYRTLAREQTAFESLAGISNPSPVAISVNGSPAEQVSIQYVSGNFFQDLGLAPPLGRAFRIEEDRIGQEPILMVSHRFWMSRLGGRANGLESTVRINNIPARIVGVAPAGFFGLRAGQWTDVYAPLAMRAAFLPRGNDGAPRGENDRDWWVFQIARVKPGVPEQAAIAQLAARFRNLVAPEESKVDPKKIPELITLPGRRGFNPLGTQESNALWILMLLVGVLLLIVCANVANLLLSRSVGRKRESAVRLALGAARSRLFRQHLIESGLLALLGGAVGLGSGYLLAQSVHLLFQTGRDASNAFDLHLDPRVMLYTGAISMATALLFGLAPALQSARADLNDALKSQARSVMGGGLRLPRMLVSLQIALCLTALVAAGLLGNSLQKLKWTEVGLDRDNLAYASVNPWQAGYSPERVGLYVDRVLQQVAAIPGVLHVGTVHIRPLSGFENVSIVRIPGRANANVEGVENEVDRVQVNRVGEGFFDTVGIPLVAGRFIDHRDIRPNSDAVVVNELFVRRFLPNQNPLGRRFGLDPRDNSRFQIVGVVRNSRYNSLRDDLAPTAYEPYLAGDLRGASIHFAMRASIDSGQLADAVRKAIASVDPAVPMTEFHTQTALIDRLLRTERLLGFLSAAFGTVALTLAAIGLAGLLAYAVARRTNEIGVRMALGAAAGDVVRMVLRDSFWMVGAGILLGLPCAYAMGRFLTSALYRMEPFDPFTTAAAFAALLLVALAAAWIPARRAARIDPMRALRED